MIEGGASSWRYQVVLVIALIAATLAIYDRLGAYEDVQITRAIVDLGAASPEDVTELVRESSNVLANVRRILIIGRCWASTTSPQGVRLRRLKTLRRF